MDPLLLRRTVSRSVAVDRRDPTGAVHLDLFELFGARSLIVASLPPEERDSATEEGGMTGWDCRGSRRHLRRNRVRRTRQNLSFVIAPSRLHYLRIGIAADDSGATALLRPSALVL